MRQAVTSIVLAGVLSVSAGVALAQPMMGRGGYGHGNGPGMMRGGFGYTDPAEYLGDLKVVLGITAAQEPEGQCGIRGRDRFTARREFSRRGHRAFRG